ncbi:conserved hypothetical protein [Agrobacterium tumefaciens str. Kerr 14]|uniref:Uncharacterized protein n=1 Tax=Agrobacterium tumefaciens str. Kerr 14 TaxID=1183424 RepID=A0A1S7S570_AGRTU|nr:conserved hypothetical protein [Agrobacterium tumefaciens str. Kerr 14]
MHGRLRHDMGIALPQVNKPVFVLDAKRSFDDMEEFVLVVAYAKLALQEIWRPSVIGH